jgi:hypothetical protein
MRTLLAVVVLATASTAHAQKPASAPVGDLETLQKVDQIQRAMTATEDLSRLVEKMTAAKNMACVKAIGAPSFCSCLSQTLPIKWTFLDYVAITTGTKEDNGYAKMSTEDKKGYDLVPAIRDRCVKESFGSKR